MNHSVRMETNIHGQSLGKQRNDIPPLRLIGSAALFGSAALLLFFATHGLIPILASRTGAEPVLLWFVAAGVGVFLPLLITGFVILWLERAIGQSTLWSERLRFRRMSKVDWLWSIAGLALVGFLSAGTVAMLKLTMGHVDLNPTFMSMEPLNQGRYWIIAAWFPFWTINIMSEELLWRGVVLPRQEVAFGRWAWVANGSGWFLFHLAFGTTILLTLWPILFILPYIVQRRQNSWIGVVIHAGLNGPGFVAVAFGLV